MSELISSPSAKFNRKDFKHNRTENLREKISSAMEKRHSQSAQIEREKLFSKNARGNPALFDVVIIGGGAAGMSAALWCDELGLKTLLLEARDKLGGQLWRVFNPIKNHLGADAQNGRGLQKTFLKQIEPRKFTTHLKSEVVKIDAKTKRVFLKNGEKIKWRFLIIATGTRRRMLGAQGEKKFQNRGILESGARDAKAVKNKRAAIVGGGDAALENALILAETASQVTVIHRRKKFTARPEFLSKARSNKKIKFLPETIVTKFIGDEKDEKLERLELKNLKTRKIFSLPFEAVLPRIGVEPNTKIFRGKIDLDGQGYIKINSNCETSERDIFAIGDAANPVSPTISSAIGMGATAAKAIFAKAEARASGKEVLER
ncbi:MAG: NAD(P)/FAD-dependent oxidoreductase [Pyrinomonadaceae bacterium]